MMSPNYFIPVKTALLSYNTFLKKTKIIVTIENNKTIKILSTKKNIRIYKLFYGGYALSRSGKTERLFFFI